MAVTVSSELLAVTPDCLGARELRMSAPREVFCTVLVRRGIDYVSTATM